MLGINFNGKHSYDDFGLKIYKKDIGFPSFNLIHETIPFMNGSYDFSSINGEISYTDRSLKYEFWIVADTKEEMNYLKIRVANWLKATEKNILIDDAILGYYFYAQVKALEFSEEGKIGKITVEFIAKPFKISIQDEGHLLWDNFDFNFDVLQNTKFDVVEYKEVTLYNVGSKKVSPIINLTNISPITPVTIEFNNNSYIITSETTGYEPFSFIQLSTGENKIKIYGTCTIEFVFRKEVL